MSFICFDVSNDVELEAQRIRAERDSQYGNIYVESSSDLRWVGEIGEIIFDRWLADQSELEYEWITDKAAGQPDFVVGTRRIDVKTVKRKVAPRMSYTAQITAQHAQEDVDSFFFMSYEFQKRKLWLLGGLTKERFLEDARYYGPGEMVHDNYRIRPGHEIYNIEIHKLVPPDVCLLALAQTN